MIANCELVEPLPDTGDKFSIGGCPVNNATHTTTVITMDVMSSDEIVWQCDVDFFLIGTTTIKKYSKRFYTVILAIHY